MDSSPQSSSSSSSGKAVKVDPILRNALRYTISAKEYEVLHQYLISRAPAVRKRTPRPTHYEAIVRGQDDYNVAAVRASLRVFVATATCLQVWDIIRDRLLARSPSGRTRPKTTLTKSPNFRLSLSLSLILLSHRLLHRFFTRLRFSLLKENARPFRRRNPRISQTLTSRLAPAVGASLAGFFLGICPSDQLRITIAIYAFSRALEFLYNAFEGAGHFKSRPWWFGSWLLVPASCGQLLHAFIFDRDCVPSAYSSIMLNNSPQYIQTTPEKYPSRLPWPSPPDIVDSLSEIARLKWPPFISPILFPNTKTLPSSVSAIAPITSRAHPAIKCLSCALLHPSDPSCLRTYISYWVQAFPRIARFFTILFTAMSLPRYKTFLADPMTSLNVLAKRILRISLFITGTIGTSWASICLGTHILPSSLIPRFRFFLGGFLAGLWAFLDRRHGRSNALYCARMSLDSFWKVGKKRGWWRGITGGDVALFAASLCLINVVYERDPKAVSDVVVRKSLGVLRGDAWVDRARGGHSASEDEHAEGEAGEELKERHRKREETGIDMPVEALEDRKTR